MPRIKKYNVGFVTSKTGQKKLKGKSYRYYTTGKKKTLKGKR